MWEAGITFGHGTGHGVGHFLGCHEGPQNVRTEDEIDWINAYHVRVYKEISPLLNSEEKSYLARKCAAIEL